MLDIYVGLRANFFRMKDYKLHYMLAGMDRAGLQWRVLDRIDGSKPSNPAFMHVDLTTLPTEYRDITSRYGRCINGKAVSIDRRQYTKLTLGPDVPYDGPVIAKTILNSRGNPELRFSSRASIASRLAHLSRRMAIPRYKQRMCPAPRIYPSLADVPAAVWADERLIVERYVPGTLAGPVHKFRFDFFFDVEMNYRSTFSSLLCDPETVEKVDLVEDVPQEARLVRRQLHLDYGSLEYFVKDDEAFVIDANKTISEARSWLVRFPAIAKHMDELTDRLIDFVRER